MAPSRTWIAGSALTLGAALIRHRRTRTNAIALLPKKLVKARGLTRRQVERAADPRRTGVW